MPGTHKTGRRSRKRSRFRDKSTVKTSVTPQRREIQRQNRHCSRGTVNLRLKANTRSNLGAPIMLRCGRPQYRSTPPSRRREAFDILALLCCDEESGIGWRLDRELHPRHALYGTTWIASLGVVAWMQRCLVFGRGEAIEGWSVELTDWVSF